MDTKWLNNQYISCWSQMSIFYREFNLKFCLSQKDNRNLSKSFKIRQKLHKHGYPTWWHKAKKNLVVPWDTAGVPWADGNNASVVKLHLTSGSSSNEECVAAVVFAGTVVWIFVYCSTHKELRTFLVFVCHSIIVIIWTCLHIHMETHKHTHTHTDR